jgi:hypothetical protein
MIHYPFHQPHRLVNPNSGVAHLGSCFKIQFRPKGGGNIFRVRTIEGLYYWRSAGTDSCNGLTLAFSFNFRIASPSFWPDLRLDSKGPTGVTHFILCRSAESFTF